MPQSFPTVLKLPFVFVFWFNIYLVFGSLWLSSRALIQSILTISPCFSFFFYFCRKTELRVVYLLFYWCNSHSKTNHFILLARFKRFLQFQNWKKIWGRVVWWFVTCLSRAPGMVWDSPRSTQCLKRFTMVSPILT